jgi:hypothetical protein
VFDVALSLEASTFFKITFSFCVFFMMEISLLYLSLKFKKTFHLILINLLSKSGAVHYICTTLAFQDNFGVEHQIPIKPFQEKSLFPAS